MNPEAEQGPEEKILPLVDLLKKSILKPRDNFINHFSLVGHPDRRISDQAVMVCESNLKALFMIVRQSLKRAEFNELKSFEIHFLKNPYGRLDKITMYRYFLHLEKALRRLGITKLERMVDEPGKAMA